MRVFVLGTTRAKAAEGLRLEAARTAVEASRALLKARRVNKDQIAVGSAQTGVLSARSIKRSRKFRRAEGASTVVLKP